MAGYTWPDGSKNHKISWVQHQQNLAAAAVKGQGTGAQIMAAGDAYYKTKGIPNPNGAPATGGGATGDGAGGAPQPFDSAFENAKLGAGFNISTGNAEAAYQTGETAWSSGINADGSLNTSNPYSQAQLFQDNHRRSQTGTNNSMAAAGQLYSGARLNAQGRNDRLYAEGSSAQRDQARDAYHGIQVGQLQNYGANSLGVSQGGYDALKRSVYGS